MIVGTEEALEMWCPFVRARVDLGDVATNRDRTGDTNGKSCCISAHCMAWRWDPKHSIMSGSARGGYCGLAGVPTP